MECTEALTMMILFCLSPVVFGLHSIRLDYCLDNELRHLWSPNKGEI